MRQRNVNRAKRTTRRQSPSAAALEQGLFGLGPCSLQLDGFRLKAPMPVWERLAGCRKQRFIFSIQHGPRLCLVPKVVWLAYLDFVCHKVSAPTQAETLRWRLSQTAIARKMDNHHRWDIPLQLAQAAELSRNGKAVVLVPNRFWLEVFAAPVWEVYMRETLQQTPTLEASPIDFEI